MNSSKLLQWAAMSGLIAVMLGAFGAHGLKPLIDEKTLHAYNTAVLYHFLHTLVLLSMALWHGEKSGNQFTWSVRLFLAGMLGFSGSLYAIALSKAAGIDISWLGPVTPMGGLLLMGGWLMLFLHASQNNKQS